VSHVPQQEVLRFDMHPDSPLQPLSFLLEMQLEFLETIELSVFQELSVSQHLRLLGRVMDVRGKQKLLVILLALMLIISPISGAFHFIYLIIYSLFFE
jgi:hypothetical protein